MFRLIPALIILMMFAPVNAPSQSQRPDETSPRQVTQSSFSILIKLHGPTTIKAGSGVVLGVILTNTSKEDLHFLHFLHKGLDYTEDLDYTVDVRDSYGLAPKTWEPENSHGSPFRVRVGPGKLISGYIVVDYLFQLNETGDYTIQVSRSSWEDSLHPVQSNKITVTITPISAPEATAASGASALVSAANNLKHYLELKAV